MHISFQLLDDREINEIHRGSLEVLAKVGMKIESKAMLKGLKEAGATVDEASSTVLFPEKLVEASIEGQRKLLASGKKLHLINGVTSQKTDKRGVQAKISGGCEKYLDWGTEQFLQASAKKLLEFIRLGQKIPEVDFVGNPIVMREDMDGKALPEAMRRIKTAALVAKHTDKLGSMEVWDEREIDLFMEMGIICKGSEEEYRADPCFVTAKETISPLFLDKDAGDILLALAKRDLPCTMIPMPITGMSTPISMQGNAVVGNAEILGVVTGIRSVYPDAVVGGGSISGIMDMQTSVATFSAPEAILQDIAIAEVQERLYGLNYLLGTGYTDAKFPNSQLLSEKTMKTLLTYLSGRYTYPVGLLDAGSVFSAEQALVDIEIARYVHGHFESSFSIGTLDEVLEVVKSAGVRGNTIGEEHTFAHFRENWFPWIMDRSSFASIEKNKQEDIYNRAHNKVQELLSGDGFWELEPEKQRAIDEVVKKAETILM